jgi:hypothetical protein
MKILKYIVPDELIAEYVKWRMFADAYLTKDEKIVDRYMHEKEITMRWSMCVQKVMKIHRQICEKLQIEYSTENDFYRAFHKEIEKQIKLKG